MEAKMTEEMYMGDPEVYRLMALMNNFNLWMPNSYRRDVIEEGTIEEKLVRDIDTYLTETSFDVQKYTHLSDLLSQSGREMRTTLKEDDIPKFNVYGRRCDETNREMLEMVLPIYEKMLEKYDRHTLIV